MILVALALPKRLEVVDAEVVWNGGPFSATLEHAKTLIRFLQRFGTPID
jgi:hypothetical protein